MIEHVVWRFLIALAILEIPNHPATKADVCPCDSPANL